MRILSVRIRNFRSFKDETINLDAHTSLLGPNGSGKSNVLSALNVFFQDPSNATNVASLTSEDFHNQNTDEPVEISVTFCDLSDRAKKELSHYVRHDELVATAVAKYDATFGQAPVERFGERLVFEKFAPFFEDERNGVKVDPLRDRFFEVIEGLPDFPDIGGRPTKPNMIDALRGYEEARPALCKVQRSNELFYGKTKGQHKIEPYVQWVYLPAVKDASEEAQEAGNTALGKLLQRTVRQKISFDEALEALRAETREKYDALLGAEQSALDDLSNRLAARLAKFSHSNASLEVVWLQGSDKSVSINDPRATIKAQEGKFKGSLPRFGHGLQRSFLLAILQELAFLEDETDDTGKAIEQPTLILACEEPELYQHPPQARYLATVLRSLQEGGSQVLLTTHSPYFVSGDTFEEIRFIRKLPEEGRSIVCATTFEEYANRIAAITERKPDKPAAIEAKLQAALRPEVAELFFADKLVLVEGIEDRAYITSTLILEGRWDTVRRRGLHILPADRKSNILQLLVIAGCFGIPTFVIFDADGDAEKEEHRRQHERDNTHLIKALNAGLGAFPKAATCQDDYAIWPCNLETEVRNDVGPEAWTDFSNSARQAFDPSASLKKNPLMIAETLRLVWKAGKKPATLVKLAEQIVRFAVT